MILMAKFYHGIFFYKNFSIQFILFDIGNGPTRYHITNIFKISLYNFRSYSNDIDYSFEG